MKGVRTEKSRSLPRRSAGLGAILSWRALGHVTCSALLASFVIPTVSSSIMDRPISRMHETSVHSQQSSWEIQASQAPDPMELEIVYPPSPATQIADSSRLLVKSKEPIHSGEDIEEDFPTVVRFYKELARRHVRAAEVMRKMRESNQDFIKKVSSFLPAELYQVCFNVRKPMLTVS